MAMLFDDALFDNLLYLKNGPIKQLTIISINYTYFLLELILNLTYV